MIDLHNSLHINIHLNWVSKELKKHLVSLPLFFIFSSYIQPLFILVIMPIQDQVYGAGILYVEGERGGWKATTHGCTGYSLCKAPGCRAYCSWNIADVPITMLCALLQSYICWEKAVSFSNLHEGDIWFGTISLATPHSVSYLDCLLSSSYFSPTSQGPNNLYQIYNPNFFRSMIFWVKIWVQFRAVYTQRLTISFTPFSVRSMWKKEGDRMLWGAF